MMQSMDAMVMTTTATGCVWNFRGAAGAPEAVSAGSAVRPEADMDLHLDALSTGSWCQVSAPVHVDVLHEGGYESSLKQFMDSSSSSF